MTDLAMQIEVNRFQRMANPDVMGYQAAAEAQSIADFLKSLTMVCYDTYVSTDFGRYIEGVARGYQFNEQEYEGLHINTTYDIRSIQIDSVTLHNLIETIKEKWEQRIYFARDNGLFKN